MFVKKIGHQDTVAALSLRVKRNEISPSVLWLYVSHRLIEAPKPEIYMFIYCYF